MLKVEVIGNLGADAEIKDANGSKFITMRIANSEKWKSQDGQEQTRTTWIDATINNADHKVFPYLKQGTKVFVRGNASLRVYSSPKDRMMKAGLQVSVTEIELVGGHSDDVPRELIVPEDGHICKVSKFYQCDLDTSKWKKEDQAILVDQRGNQFVCVKGGWCAPQHVPQDDQEG